MPAKKTKLVEIKTKATIASVDDFVNAISDEQTRDDCHAIIKMMEKASGDPAVMWGPAIIGFGHRIYTSEKTGRSVDWMKIGFSPRKANISLYLSVDINKHADTLKKLGKHKTGKGCLYINKLADVDVKVLEGLIKESLKNK